ncbi:MAG TPA: ATP-binding protein [Usitatibacter sp.]|nr:ATP-binding protein [Usitatibacter sp.]
MNDSTRPAFPLIRRCDPADIPFATTSELEGPSGVIGQERAASALDFAFGIAGDDYNVFVMGPEGSGRHTLVHDNIARRTRGLASASDWIYVNNFKAPQQPLAIELPACRGAALRDDVEALVAELRAAIPALFESEEYSHRVEKIDKELGERRDQAFGEISQQAEREHVAFLRTPAGYGFAPTKDGNILASEDFDKLPETERDRFAGVIAALQERLEKAIRDAMRGRKERAERIQALNREMVQLVVGPPVDALVGRYRQFPKVVAWLEAGREDVLESADSFQSGSETTPVLTALGPHPFNVGLRRYAVNLLVDRRDAAGPEIVYCDHPTYANLVGRVEHIQHLGTLVTDFTLLKAGALHRANGGYLVIDAIKLLQQPFAWDALKRALMRRDVRIEPASDLWGFAATVGLEPEPIPLAVKVVLIGDRRLYYLLEAYDPDFPRLFKVVADFEDTVERDAASTASYATMVGRMAREEALLPLDRAAVARAVDEAARRAADSRKLSADLAALNRLLHEADFLARKAKREVVGAADVEAALEAQRTRADRIRRRTREAVERGTILIDTSGSKVGQVNGIALVPVGDFPFGEPMRITATTRVGEGQVIDIQREAHLGGAIHSKGVMILSQFLASRFSANRPHALTASLVFEQTYGEVEGDSASLAELCALLSSLAGVPLRQSIAVTGSVNQLGEVQAVGGVNEKIEGFFEVCEARGLAAEQGVVVPFANLDNLMLREPVVRAAERGLFRIHPVAHVDEAIEILTGMPAGTPELAAGGPQATINGRVARRLRELARLQASAKATAVAMHARKRGPAGPM